MTRITLVALGLVSLAAGKTAMDSPDYAHHFQSAPVHAGDVTASASSAFARQNDAKLKVKFDNRSDDFLVVAKNGARISSSAGEYVATNRDGFEVIDPTSDGRHTFVFEDGGGKLCTLSMVARLDGVFLASGQGEPVQAEPFTLPLSANKVEAGGFLCITKGKVKQETQEAKAKFECTYQGAEGTAGLLDSKAITVAIPDGQAFANESGKPTKLLLPGEKASFEVKNSIIRPNPHDVDMQLTQLTLLWNDALRTVTMQPVAFPDWEFSLDLDLTAEKNK